MNPAVERRLKQIPPKYRALHQRCIDGKASPREAIQANCYECFGWAGNGMGKSLQTLVTECTSVACAFHPLRPRNDGASELAPSGTSDA
jgi:hypothetical protein